MNAKSSNKKSLGSIVLGAIITFCSVLLVPGVASAGTFHDGDATAPVSRVTWWTSDDERVFLTYGAWPEGGMVPQWYHCNTSSDLSEQALWEQYGAELRNDGITKVTLSCGYRSVSVQVDPPTLDQTTCGQEKTVVVPEGHDGIKYVQTREGNIVTVKADISDFHQDPDIDYRFPATMSWEFDVSPDDACDGSGANPGTDPSDQPSEPTSETSTAPSVDPSDQPSTSTAEPTTDPSDQPSEPVSATTSLTGATAGTNTADQLPTTGAESVGLIAGSLAFLILGGLLMVARRKA